jgi:tetratricopeptide (TPR) repeat protein
MIQTMYAQNTKKLDSILKVTSNEIYINPDNVIKIGQDFVKNSGDNIEYTIKGYKLISDAYSSKRDYQKSLEYLIKASELLDQTNNKFLKINIINKTGIQYHQLKVYDKAMQYLDQAEQLIAEYPVKDSIHIELGKNYMIRGFIYKEKDLFVVREISEINFRYTMGRILYEVSNFFSEHKEHSLLTVSLKDHKNSREDSLLELEERVKVQLENITKKKYKECILLTPPFLGGKLVSSCVVYYGT